MINQLIQSLKSSKNFGKKFKSNHINYTVLTSGGYRKYDKGRIVVIIFDNSEPRLIVKFYKNGNSVSDEYKTQTQIYKIYGNLITKPMGMENFNNYELLIEEPVLGKNLTRYIHEHLNSHTLLGVFKLISDFNKNLNSKLESSDIQNFSKELDHLIQIFYSDFEISNVHEDMIKNLRSVFLKNFENKKIFQRFSNNDFILNNFLIHKNKITLTDFEFSTKTHLYFLEWFKFFRYQWKISNDYVYDLTISEITDPFYKLGLREFSNYKLNEKFELSCRLIFEIFDFTKRIDISSPSVRKILINDMKKFLNELYYRYNNPDMIQKKSNLSSSEKSFFNQEYQQLTKYKEHIDELIDLRISNDEHSIELQNTFKSLDKITRGFNEQEFSNKNLRKRNDELRDEVSKLHKHHDELRDEVSKLRTHNDELRDEVSKLRTHNDELRDEIKRIILDHNNYKYIIESSMIWKLMNNLEKLFGKKH
ncbi:MAG: hypothetical protein CXT78_01560 [Thaumarchaeota archaeon]|jgi:uncharacterized protein YfkK (UPF0435 family)/cell division protein FtsB|nr:MAG: hypothetical protein CXT78_01560 [Nitrososphaerota archaeon]